MGSLFMLMGLTTPMTWMRPILPILYGIGISVRLLVNRKGQEQSTPVVIQLQALSVSSLHYKCMDKAHNGA